MIFQFCMMHFADERCILQMRKDKSQTQKEDRENRKTRNNDVIAVSSPLTLLTQFHPSLINIFY